MADIKTLNRTTHFENLNSPDNGIHLLKQAPQEMKIKT